MFPPGSLIVAVQPLVYESEAAGGTQRILYERRTTLERKPLGTGFTQFSLRSNFDKGTESSMVELSFGTADCELKREFAVSGHGAFTKPGKWWIREGELFLEPWLIASEEVSK